MDSCAQESDLPAYRKYLEETGSGGKRVPIVSLERDLWFGCNAVEAENYQGAAAAAGHLFANGRRRILFLTGDRDWKMLSERARGYREALEPHGLPAVVLAEEGGMSMPAGYQAIRRAIEQGREFDAVFAANDRMAVGAILALKQYGRAVPQEVSVVGFDNIDVYQLFEPAPSTVNVPKYLMGYRAAEMMIHLVEGRARTLPVVRLKTDLVVRRSSDKDARGSLVLTGL